jgi:hypothetical protein
MTELYDKLSMNGIFRVGLDGSANQIVDRRSSIKWYKAASQGVDFMIWRMSIGGFYKDLSFIPNMVNAAEAGVTIRGAYVVVRPDYNLSTHMALIEEQFRELEQIEGPQTPKPLIWLDVETYALKKKTASGVLEITRKFTPKEINQRTIQLADAVKDLQGGVEPGFYSYGDFVISKMGTEVAKSLPGTLQGSVLVGLLLRPIFKCVGERKALSPLGAKGVFRRRPTHVRRHYLAVRQRNQPK